MLVEFITESEHAANFPNRIPTRQNSFARKVKVSLYLCPALKPFCIVHASSLFGRKSAFHLAFLFHHSPTCRVNLYCRSAVKAWKIFYLPGYSKREGSEKQGGAGVLPKQKTCDGICQNATPKATPKKGLHNVQRLRGKAG